MGSLRAWILERQEDLPTGSVRLCVTRIEHDHGCDPGQSAAGEETGELSFESKSGEKQSFFRGTITVRLTSRGGVEASMDGSDWRVVRVKGGVSFTDSGDWPKYSYRVTIVD